MHKKGRIITSILVTAAALTAIFGILSVESGASPKLETISAEKQYADAREGVLYIRCFYASDGLKTTGSGFIIRSNGLAVTAAHVIDKAARITAVDSDGKELSCDVVSCDMASDVAVLRLPKDKYKALQLADKAPAGGATLRAVGYPLKDTLIITEGLLSSPSGTINEKNRMLVSCDIVNGMSGGPIFDQYGRIVGMCSGSVRTMSGIHLSALYSDLKTAIIAAEKSK